MNNKPVAELLINDGEPWGCRYSDEGTFFNANGSRMDGWIPLYTHPVKELTDEEIEEVIRKHWNREYKNRGMMEFAKAILRKAQEK